MYAQQFFSVPPRNTEIEQSTATVGDTLSCTSDANPAVVDGDYSWDINGTVYYGQTVELLPEHEGNNLIKCCAKNEIRGQPYEECDEKNFNIMSKCVYILLREY